mmetsp:Transcript_19475/g.39886  ORF Transcript_19475/g.39886 Transcript_19475/m.39886 type:complete len:208 (+) Transcript_19475:661-1284(+)
MARPPRLRPASAQSITPLLLWTIRIIAMNVIRGRRRTNRRTRPAISTRGGIIPAHAARGAGPSPIHVQRRVGISAIEISISIVSTAVGTSPILRHGIAVRIGLTATPCQRAEIARAAIGIGSPDAPSLAGLSSVGVGHVVEVIVAEGEEEFGQFLGVVMNFVLSGEAVAWLLLVLAAAMLGCMVDAVVVSVVVLQILMAERRKGEGR